MTNQIQRVDKPRQAFDNLRGFVEYSRNPDIDSKTAYSRVVAEEFLVYGSLARLIESYGRCVQSRSYEFVTVNHLKRVYNGRIIGAISVLTESSQLDGNVFGEVEVSDGRHRRLPWLRQDTNWMAMDMYGDMHTAVWRDGEATIRPNNPSGLATPQDFEHNIQVSGRIIESMLDAIRQ